MACAELTGKSEGGVIREAEVQSTFHGNTVVLQIGNTRCIAIEVFLLETGNLMEVTAAKRGLAGVADSSCNRVIRKRLVLNHTNLLVIDNLVAVTLHAVERRLLILSLTGETEAHQRTLQRRAVTVLKVFLDNRTGEIDHECIEQAIVQITFPAYHTFELAGWRLEGDNLCTTDCLTDARGCTTENNLDFSDSILGHIDRGTLTNVTLHGDHAALTTGGTGATVRVSHTTNGSNDTLHRVTRHTCDIIARQALATFGCTYLNDGHLLLYDLDSVKHCSRGVQFHIDDSETRCRNVDTGTHIGRIADVLYFEVILANRQRLDGIDTIEVGNTDKHLFAILLGNNIDERHRLFCLGVNDRTLHRALCQGGHFRQKQESECQ